MMAGYRYMHNWQAGSFLHGNHAVSQQQLLEQGCPDSQLAVANGVLPNGCKSYPGEMTMGMHMLELMYAPVDWLSLMLMPQFVDMQMPIYPNPATNTQDALHRAHGHLHQSGGIGDTGLYALVKLFDRPSHHLHTSLGVTAPTGDASIKLLGEDDKNLDGPFIHYGMQLGSGTWDFKPSLTYLGNSGAWNWGAQVVGTKRLGYRNASGYKLGDIFEATVWGGYDLTRWLSGAVRMAYTWQDAIKGRYHRSTRLDYQLPTCDKAIYTIINDPDGNGIPNGPPLFDQISYNQCLADRAATALNNDRRDRPTPMDFPKNYGGQYVDLGLGISATVPDGAFVGNRLAFEWLQPIYTNVNGYQLDRDGALSFTWSYGF